MPVNIYKPSPVLLPPHLMMDERVSAVLFDYMAELGKGKGYNFIQPLEWFLGEQADLPGGLSADKDFVFLTDSDKHELLKQHPLPLFFDVFWTQTNNKLIALGPAMPELWDAIGKPKIIYKSGLHSQGLYSQGLPSNKSPVEQQLSYTMGDINRRNAKGKNMVYSFALTYLVIDLPENKHADAISDKSPGSLTFQWNDFSQTIRLQANPFIEDAPKLTLVTLQKDNPAQWIEDWCNYYHSEHKVKRIIIYNNAPHITDELRQVLTDFDDKMQSTADVEMPADIWLVVWDCPYQLWFSQCQSGALAHSYWWLMNAASYFLNFDVDEYLVNDSSLKLEEYLVNNTQAGRRGLLLPGYEVPIDIGGSGGSGGVGRGEGTGGNRADASFCNKQPQDPLSDAKSIYAAMDWQLLTPHCIFCKEFFPPPLVWHLLVNGNNGFKNKFTSFCAKYFYQFSMDIFYKLQGLKRILGLTASPSAFAAGKIDRPYMHYTDYASSTNEKGLYFLHYRSMNTNWKWRQDNPHLQSQGFNPDIHVRL